MVYLIFCNTYITVKSNLETSLNVFFLVSTLFDSVRGVSALAITFGHTCAVSEGQPIRRKLGVLG